MKKTIYILFTVVVLLFPGCNKDDSADTVKDTISNYVKLDFNYLGNQMPVFEFLKETGGTYSSEITNVIKGDYNQTVSYDGLYTFPSTGNTYKIIITSITRTYINYPPGGSYTANITAKVGTKTITGILNYP